MIRQPCISSGGGGLPNVKLDFWKFDAETNTLVYRYTLKKAQDMKQEENRILFAEYLESHPLTWVDGKEYGITEADQLEINLILNQYQLAAAANVDTPTLEWHAQHEENVLWSLEKLTALSLKISEIVYPIYHKMQDYKTAIYNCTTTDELEINYE